MHPELARWVNAGETVLSAKACYTDPELVELMASSGFDALWLCREHKQIQPDVFYEMIQAWQLGVADAIACIKPRDMKGWFSQPLHAARIALRREFKDY